MPGTRKKLTFMDLYIDGVAPPEEINAHIARWHKGAGKPMPVFEFLGMTHIEYETWTRDASALPDIVRTRHRDLLRAREGRPIEPGREGPDDVFDNRAWSVIHKDDDGMTARMIVPGGWLYRYMYSDEEPNGQNRMWSSITFVPKLDAS